MSTFPSRRFVHVLGLAGALLVPGLAQGQTAGPAGSYFNVISSPTNLVWDMTAIFNTNLNYLVRDRQEIAVVRLIYSVSMRQDGFGRLVGRGSNTVQLRYVTNSLPLNPTNPVLFHPAAPFTGKYKVGGQITSRKGVSSGYLQTTLFGLAEIQGRRGRTNAESLLSVSRVVYSIDNSAVVTVTNKIRNTVTNDVGTIVTNLVENIITNVGWIVSGRYVSAYSPSLGNFLSSTPPSGQMLSSSFAGNGSWQISMTWSTDQRNKVTGQASIILNRGGTNEFTLRGVFNPKTQLSTLTLKGIDTAKGSHLTVKLEGNTVKSFKGILFGQSVNATF